MNKNVFICPPGGFALSKFRIDSTEFLNLSIKKKTSKSKICKEKEKNPTSKPFLSLWPLQNAIFSSNKFQITYIYKVIIIINAKIFKKNYGHHEIFPITSPCYMSTHRTSGHPTRSPWNHSSPVQLIPSPFLSHFVFACFKLLWKLFTE